MEWMLLFLVFCLSLVVMGESYSFSGRRSGTVLTSTNPRHSISTIFASNTLPDTRTEAEFTKSDPWSFLDRVYLITTDKSDKSRLGQTKAALERVNLWNKVVVKTFPTDDEDRVRGCYSSHMKVLAEVQRDLQRKEDYRVLILEDNLETTPAMNPGILQSVAQFMNYAQQHREQGFVWDAFHLAYMMYVPGLKMLQLNRHPLPGGEDLMQKDFASNVVQMIAEKSAAVGTSAYVVSKSGVNSLLTRDKKLGFTDAIPNIMAELFPNTRFACYPMVFHRAGKVTSLVNPQLDDFRRIMFNPAMYSFWERLMVSTGLQNNQLFPAICATLAVGTLSALYQSFSVLLHTSNPASETQQDIITASSVLLPSNLFSSVVSIAVVLGPLLVALWGASLFKPGNTGAGFATSTKKK